MPRNNSQDLQYVQDTLSRAMSANALGMHYLTGCKARLALEMLQEVIYHLETVVLVAEEQAAIKQRGGEHG